MNKNLYSFLSGIVIGTCMILPGVSGSVVAIMLGVYEEVIFLINNNNFSNLYKIKKILPLVIGIMAGIFIFGKVLLSFYNNYQYQMMYIFIGLILGSIPILFREISQKKEKINIKFFIISLMISIILFLLPKLFDFKIPNNLNFFNLFAGGFLYVSGKILPGISSSFFLMLLGLYDYILTIIANPFSITLDKIVTLIPFFLGAFIGLYVFIKLMNILLNKYFSETYSCIIGFIIGSTFALFPGIELSIRGVFSFLFMISSYQLVNKLSKKSQKK